MARKRKSGPDLAARFAKLSESITTEAEKALLEIGMVVRDAAAGNAPVASGTLAGSYAVRMRYRGTQPRAVVGTLAKHATYVEFAKQVHGHKYGKNLPEPARVLYKALDDNVGQINKMVADAVSRGIGGVDGA